jgi:methyl-accepting chemotaxis protein
MAKPEAQKHSIGLIGGGKSGLAMLRFLLKTNVSNIVFVVDLDASAPAIVSAKANKIPTFTKLDDALRLPLPDFIFEITVNQDDTEKLKVHLRGTPTRIINQATSRMIVELVEDNRAQLQKEVSETVLAVKSELLTTLDSSQGLVDRINQIMVSMQMLALNAAIEAAKVGQAGKGFAVVAENITKSVDTVRKLTQEINEVNTTIGKASSQIETVLEKLQ